MEFKFEAPDGMVFLKYRQPPKVEKAETGLYKINERKNQAVTAEVHSVGMNVEGIWRGDTITAELATIWEVSDGIFCVKEEDILLVHQPMQTA